MVEIRPYFPILESEIAKRGIRKKDIAKSIGITERSLTKKLSGETDWWWNEVLAIHAIFPYVPPEKLFEHNSMIMNQPIGVTADTKS